MDELLTQLRHHQQLRHYALHGIPEVWLLDLNEGVLTVHRDPAKGQYRQESNPRAGETVSPLLLARMSWQLKNGKSWVARYRRLSFLIKRITNTAIPDFCICEATAHGH